MEEIESACFAVWQEMLKAGKLASPQTEKQVA
jgi:hypothetical protein